MKRPLSPILIRTLTLRGGKDCTDQDEGDIMDSISQINWRKVIVDQLKRDGIPVPKDLKLIVTN